MRIGDWNVAIGVVGGPGCGKSTYAQARVRQIRRETPCYIVAHDPTYSYRGPDVLRHATPQALAAALRSKEHARMIHCLDVARGLDVVRVALDVSTVARAQKDPVPTLVALDEIVTAGDMTPSYMDPMMSEAYALRRHRHIGFIFCSQRPQQVHPMVWEMSTEIVLFRLTVERQRKYFEDAGVSRETIERAMKLPYFWHPSAPRKPERIPAGAPTSRDLSACYVIHKT